MDGSMIPLASYHTSNSHECMGARAYKNGWLEWERVTPIEARSQGKIIEPY